MRFVRFAASFLLVGCVGAGAPGYFRFPVASVQVQACPLPTPVVMEPHPFPESGTVTGGSGGGGPGLGVVAAASASTCAIGGTASAVCEGATATGSAAGVGEVGCSLPVSAGAAASPADTCATGATSSALPGASSTASGATGAASGATADFAPWPSRADTFHRLPLKTTSAAGPATASAVALGGSAGGVCAAESAGCFTSAASGVHASASASPLSTPCPLGALCRSGISAEGIGPDAARASVAAEAMCALPSSSALPVCTEFFGVPLDGSTDIIFLLDRSASMSETAYFGDQSQQPGSPYRVDGVAIGVPHHQAGPLLPNKLTVAKSELLKVLEHLPDGTRFAIAFFGDDLTWFAPGLTVLDAASRAEARRFTGSVHPRGATAAVPALTAAFALAPRRVVLLSDGLPNFAGTDAELLTLARAQIKSGVRFDTISVGSVEGEPHAHGSFLASLAAESGGVSHRY